jgi:uncharacterized small protein (DUF1192 family)
MQDDEDIRPPAGRLQPLRLDPLGVAELEAYIAELRSEILRVEADIMRKRGHRDAAAAFFKRS